jgi:hypothetical protein
MLHTYDMDSGNKERRKEKRNSDSGYQKEAEKEDSRPVVLSRALLMSMFMQSLRQRKCRLSTTSLNIS